MTLPGSEMLPVIDGYSIERELGGGGMSRVFLATEAALNRRVVVKVLGRELAQGLSADRFAREIALAAQLQDPHIVPVHAAGSTADGVPFFTMPYVEGESLRERLLRGPVPLDETLRLLRDVAEALEYAHARGIVHRDIKPANILLSGRGAVVADFGIAKAITAARGGDTGSTPRDASATLTSAGMSLGTPAYMAPEQAVGDTTDHRADLYAWGMVAYELLAGGHPFASRTTAAQLVTAQLSEMPRALDEVRPGLPPTLGALVMQCLAKSPDARPASATALLGQLGTVGTAAAGDISGARPFMRASQRPAWQRVATMAAVVLLVAAGAFALFSRQAPAESPTDERTLAVLPFEHQGDSTESYLTDGVTDEIRSRLARVPGMNVIARGSVMPYQGSTRTPREIAEELGVRYLMTGTVRVIGTGDARRVLVRPELVEVTPDGQARSKWGEAIELPISDVVRVQGEVAGRVAAALEVEVAPVDRARLTEVPTTDPAAYDAYLRGQAITNWSSDSRATTSARAIPMFEEAVRRDSMLVDAWGALARARLLLYTNGREQSPALEAAARAAVERTVALAPTSAVGLIARSGYRRFVERDLDGARADLEAAVRADPSDMRARGNLGYLLEQEFERSAEALPHYERAAALDPRAAQIQLARSRVLAYLGRYEDARRAADRSLALSPTNGTLVQNRILIDMAAGDMSAARESLARLVKGTKDLTGLLALSNLVGFLMDSSTMSRALAVRANEFDGDRGEWATALAYSHFLRGDTASARTWGDSAVRFLGTALSEDASTKTLIDLGYAQALAGRTTAAAATANRLVAQLRAETPRRVGYAYRLTLAEAANIAMIAVARDSALAWLAELRRGPSLVSPTLLRVDPTFTPLRGDPRFEALLAPQPWEKNRQ